MCAPSLVETSTSTGSGDQLIHKRGVAHSSASSSPPGIHPTPPFPSRRPTSPPGSFSEKGWGDRLTRDELFGDYQNPEARGGAFFLDSLSFPPRKTKWSVSALSLLILTVCVGVREYLKVPF